MKPCIRLRGISGDVKGRTWEAENILRAGRLNTLEIVLDDSSVSRKHAEVRMADNNWWVRDLDSTNGTYVNGVRLGNGERQLHARDIVQFGKVAMMVELPEAENVEHPSSADQIIVENTVGSSWQEGFERLLLDRNQCPRPGDQLLALLRAGHHLNNIETEQELLHSILNDAVSVLDAQRGAIVLADGPENELKLQALATGRGEQSNRFSYSKKLAQRVFGQGRSILCCSVEEDEELKGSASIADGSMASVLCVLLRTPRKHLGVIHLDRSYWQKPFTEDDLHLADALAANVSAGIECAQLLRKQRDMFLHTITALAQAIEMRDEYTGGHTARVTAYSVLLAEHLQIPAKDLEWIRIGTPLHDIGKIGIDDEILRKPGKLTDAEFDKMRKHTTLGDDILRTIPDLALARPIVRSHHEKWDGTGYPDRLKGEQIPLLARIVAVADAFDAMTSSRPYYVDRRGKSPDEAFAEVERCAGKHFDPVCAKAFLEIQDLILEAMRTVRTCTILPRPS